MILDLIASLGVGIIFTAAIHAIFIPFTLYNTMKTALYRYKCKQMYLNYKPKRYKK
jgi:hypothetical protein